MNSLLSSLREKANARKQTSCQNKPGVVAPGNAPVSRKEVAFGDAPKPRTVDYPVLAEIGVTGTELHKIAGGECVTLSDGALGVRFLLQRSFKSKYSNFVVNHFKIQVVALGKGNVMHKEDIAVKTRVKSVIKEKLVKAKKPEAKTATQAKIGQTEMH